MIKEIILDIDKYLFNSCKGDCTRCWCNSDICIKVGKLVDEYSSKYINYPDYSKFKGFKKKY